MAPTKTQIVAEPGAPFIEITREFAAPRELLFRAPPIRNCSCSGSGRGHRR